jgi:hypothetical protein
MTKTPHMSMNFLIPNQANKEICFNESLLIIDVLLCGSAVDLGINQQPDNPKEGDVYILGESPEGKWAGKAKYITYFFQGWRFIIPKAGMSFFIVEKNELRRFIDNNWVKVG